MNPYGVWSPSRPKSEDSSPRHSEFETAREYNNPNIFGDSCWHNDHYGGYLEDSFIDLSTNTGIFNSEDKFIMSIDAEENFRQEIRNISVTDKPEIYCCSFPLCDCCSGNITERNKKSNSSIYGRYQIMADETEILDECEEDECQLKKVDECQEAVVWKSNSLYEQDQASEKNSLELDPVKKEPDKNSSLAVEGDTFTDNVAPWQKTNGKEKFASNSVNEKLDKGDYGVQLVTDNDSNLDINDVDDFGPFGTVDRVIQDAEATGVEGEDHGLADELQFYGSHEDEYENFELRIVHRKNRTGFEENKDFPIVLNSVIAGRYYVTEYLGAAAFSRVVQAHDLQTGVNVCLKIIKNNKDFFDQSLDEIKLLKFVNKHDPADQCHILRLYDYFYHQAIARQCLEALEYLHHLRIVHCDLKPENILIKSYSRCEVKIIDLGSSCFLTDTLCLYVQSRSYRAPEVIIGLPYDEKIDIWSLGCILAELYTGDVLFPNESLITMLTRMIGILGPIDADMLSKGQETHKYFTDDYDLYRKNEETGQVEYLIPEKSSLAHHLQANDAAFLDFLRSLLQINPKRRPSASQALELRWLSVVYS